MELAAVEKMIIYIPVEEATFGGTPKLSSKGLKMAPPPNPTADPIMPPKSEKNIKVSTLGLFRNTS